MGSCATKLPVNSKEIDIKTFQKFMQRVTEIVCLYGRKMALYRFNFVIYSITVPYLINHIFYQLTRKRIKSVHIGVQLI